MVQGVFLELGSCFLAKMACISPTKSRVKHRTLKKNLTFFRLYQHGLPLTLIFGVYSVQITVVDGSQIFFIKHTTSPSSPSLYLYKPHLTSCSLTHLSCESVGWLDEQRWSIPLV